MTAFMELCTGEAPSLFLPACLKGHAARRAPCLAHPSIARCLSLPAATMSFDLPDTDMVRNMRGRQSKLCSGPCSTAAPSHPHVMQRHTHVCVWLSVDLHHRFATGHDRKGGWGVLWIHRSLEAGDETNKVQQQTPASARKSACAQHLAG